MRILFMGRKDVGARCLDWLISEGHSIEAVLTDSHLDGSPTAAVANKHGLRLLTQSEARAQIQDGSLDYDLGLSVVYWRRITADMIKVATRGIVNFHPAPLPDYKGTAGYNIAILRNLKEWAVSAHYVDELIDNGPIIHVERFAIDADTETARSIEHTSQQALVRLFKATVADLQSSEAFLPAYPNTGGEYFTRQDMEAMKLVEANDDVDRKIRAFWFPPYSGATVSVEGRKYTLVNDKILDEIAQLTSGTSLKSPGAQTGPRFNN